MGSYSAGPRPSKVQMRVMGSWLEDQRTTQGCLPSPRWSQLPSEGPKRPTQKTDQENLCRAQLMKSASSLCCAIPCQSHAVAYRVALPQRVVSDSQHRLHTRITREALNHLVPQPHSRPLNPTLWGWGSSMRIV